MSEEAGGTEPTLPKERAPSPHNNESTENNEHLPHARPSSVLTLESLHRPHKWRTTILIVGLVGAVLDLCCLPITYYYALKFDTGLTLQEGIQPGAQFPRHQADNSIRVVFAVITGVYGLLSFTHYSIRSLKLFRPKTSPKWRPVGWTKWGIVRLDQQDESCKN